MTEALLTRTDQAVVDTRPPSPLHQLPDAATTAERAVTEALAYCARMMSLKSGAAVEAIRQGNRAACAYCRYAIAQEVAETIGALDEHVQAVYTLDYDATPEDVCFGKTAPETSLIHLIVWTERKTAALGALAAVLDRALVQAYAQAFDVGTRSSLLDVQIVDDQDVGNGIGYGAMLASIHHPPIQIWQRKP